MRSFVPTALEHALLVDVSLNDKRLQIGMTNKKFCPISAVTQIKIKIEINF